MTKKVLVRVSYSDVNPRIAARYSICYAIGKGKVYVTENELEKLRLGKILQKGWFYIWMPQSAEEEVEDDKL